MAKAEMDSKVEVAKDGLVLECLLVANEAAVVNDRVACHKVLADQLEDVVGHLLEGAEMKVEVVVGDPAFVHVQVEAEEEIRQPVHLAEDATEAVMEAYDWTLQIVEARKTKQYWH